MIYKVYYSGSISSLGLKNYHQRGKLTENILKTYIENSFRNKKCNLKIMLASQIPEWVPEEYKIDWIVDTDLETIQESNCVVLDLSEYSEKNDTILTGSIGEIVYSNLIGIPVLGYKFKDYNFVSQAYSAWILKFLSNRYHVPTDIDQLCLQILEYIYKFYFLSIQVQDGTK